MTNENFTCYKCEEVIDLKDRFISQHDICKECVGDLHKEFESYLSDASKSVDEHEHYVLLNEAQNIKSHIQAISGSSPAADYGDYAGLILRP